MLSQKESEYEEYSSLKKLKYTCLESCYSKFDGNMKNSGSGKAMNLLKNCTQECNEPCLDVDKYLKNTNFLSFTKLEMCAEACASENKAKSGPMRDCFFECFSRLERRNRGYWLRHRDQLIKRYFPDYF